MELAGVKVKIEIENCFYFFIYIIAHTTHTKGYLEYISNLGVYISYTPYHHTLFFSQIFTNDFFLFFYTSFLSYILSDSIYNNKINKYFILFYYYSYTFSLILGLNTIAVKKNHSDWEISQSLI